MTVLYANNATTTLANPISTTVQLTIDLAVGDGALFPDPTAPDFFWATLEDASGNIEIVQIESRLADELTVSATGRGADGTTAQTWAAGDRLEIRVTRALLDIFLQGPDEEFAAFMG